MFCIVKFESISAEAFFDVHGGFMTLEPTISNRSPTKLVGWGANFLLY